MPDAVPEPRPSEAGAWRRWTPAELPDLARAAGLRWPPTTDLAGRPLPPLAQISDLLSSLTAYMGLTASDAGLPAALHAAVLAELAADVEAVVLDLRARGFDLLWRPEPAPGVAGGLAALAVDRRPG